MLTILPRHREGEGPAVQAFPASIRGRLSVASSVLRSTSGGAMDTLEPAGVDRWSFVVALPDDTDTVGPATNGPLSTRFEGVVPLHS